MLETAQRGGCFTTDSGVFVFEENDNSLGCFGIVVLADEAQG